jgi:inorganic pyrophosphatase
MESINCTIETPKGCGAKYSFDPKLNGYLLQKVLPAGLVFPFDFGFIPGTVGEDGDPLDVIIISEIPSFPGCIMKCRIIGAIKALQREKEGDEMRNDRYIAIPDVSVMYERIRKIDQLPKQVVQEIERFFINYNDQAGKQFKPLSWMQSTEALKCVKEAQDHAEPTKLVQMLLPLYDNEGHPFPEKLYSAIKKGLVDKFGGVTMYAQAPASGLWKEAADKLVKDKVVVYEVMTSEIDTSFWKDYKGRLQKQFKQAELVIRRSEIGLL